MLCPPHAALDTAWAVQAFGGLYVDANAISPATAREVALMVEEGGATYVDGGIIGLPPVMISTSLGVSLLSPGSAGPRWLGHAALA